MVQCLNRLETLCPSKDDYNSLCFLFTSQVVQCLNRLETLCPSKDDYSSLCFLLSRPKLSDHPDFQDWNPSTGRVQCFNQILPLVNKYLPVVEVSLFILLTWPVQWKDIVMWLVERLPLLDCIYEFFVHDHYLETNNHYLETDDHYLDTNNHYL